MEESEFDGWAKAKVEDILKDSGEDPRAAFSQLLPMISDMCSRGASESLRRRMCPVHEHCDYSCHHAQITGGSTSFHQCSGPGKCDWTCIPIRIQYEPMTFGSVQIPDISNSRHSVEDDRRAEVYDSTWLDSKQLGSFKYERLPSDQPVIRLLRIQQGVFREDVIQCELEMAYLHEDPAYWALSYHWGPPVFDQKIMCNGKVLMVTKNLVDALKGFRRSAGGKELPNVLWVDAICINQSDIPEVNAQIRIMQQIYEKGQGVFVSLGNIDRSWYLGFDLMHRVSTIINYLDGHMRFKFSRDQLLKDFGFPPLNHAAWSTLGKIFATSWFTRTWIIQEITFANQALVQFGDFTFWWDILQATWRFMLVNGLLQDTMHSPSDPEQKARLGGNNMANLVWLRDMRVAGRLKDVPILETMTRAKDFAVTDPRDKIIAILGLMGIQEHTPLDYSLTVTELYKQFAIYLIKRELGMEMIHYAGLDRRGPLALDMPSWVPDWIAQSLMSSTKHIMRLRPKPYRAGGPQGRNSIVAAPVGSPAEGKSIAVVMCKVSKIIRLSNSACAMSSPNAFVPWHDEVYELWETVCWEGLVTYVDKTDAFCRTLIADGLDQATLKLLYGWSEKESIQEQYREAVQEARDDSRGHQRSDQTTSHVGYKIQCLTTCAGRRFAVTDDGKIGVVPACAKPGDGIAVILGVSVPFVVRPTQYLNDWQLIGDCYIHGIMNGEALKVSDPDMGIAKIS